MKWTAPLVAGLVIHTLVFGATSDALDNTIRANQLPALGTLLKQPANANLADDRGVTPLMNAAVAGSVEAMKLLLDRGADPRARNAFGSTALMWSATDLRKIRLLLERGADVNAVSKQGRIALLVVVMSDASAEIVRLLIAKGGSVRAVDGMQTTALLAVTQGNCTDTVRILLDTGLDVNASDFAGFTALMNASSNGNLAVVKMLMAKGAKVNSVSGPPGAQVKNGTIALGNFTALHFAATLGPADLVKALLDAGAAVNVKDARGMTPLMLAVGTDRQDAGVVALLLAQGADTKVTSLAGETALDWARKFGNTPVLEALQRGGAPGSTAAREAVVPAAVRMELKPAVARGLSLMEKTSGQFFAKGGCISCHQQNVTDIAASAAAHAGVYVNDKAVAERKKQAQAFYGPAGPALLERMDVAGSPDQPLYVLAALASAGYVPDRTTDALLANVVAQQTASGAWHLGGVTRPPVEDGDFFRTALGIRAVKSFGPAGRAVENQDRVHRAVAWLEAATPLTAEDRNMQLLGSHWAGADPGAIQKAAAGITATQRPDGGWAPRRQLATDAYATGQSLFALAEGAGLSPTAPEYAKGVNWLLSNQRGDGSWFVRSRAPKFQPYFESGFPYGQDQWISSMATGWATSALAVALPRIHPALRAGK